jgi:Na+-transporting NADH:ubiquinone oxidoreductase subunit NqrE
MMETDVQLQRLFAREPVPAPDAALVAAVIAGVERQRRNARMVSVAIGVCVLLATAALAPVVTMYLSQGFAALQGVSLRGAHIPLLTTALMALASIGVGAWATRN